MDRKTYYIVVSVFVCAALILSYIYFPSSEDVAWMYFYDRQYARSSKKFYEFFMQKSGTKKAIVPKVMLDLEFANVDQAIDTVEAYVKENPKDLEARIFLGELYKKASRPYAYLRNLEVLYSLTPDVKILRELQESYKNLNKTTSQLRALQQLVNQKEATVDDFRTLAQLYAARDNMALALKTIREMLKRFAPAKLDDRTTIFVAGLLLDNQLNSEAFLFTSKYATAHPTDLEVILALSYKILETGNYDEAKFLADLIPDSQKRKPEVMELMMTILVSQEDERGVYEILETAFDNGRLLPAFYTRLILLAITFKNERLPQKMLKELKYAKVSQTDLVNLIDSLIALKKTALAKELQKNLGEDYIRNHPVIELGLVLAEKENISELNIAELEEKYSPRDRIQLAQFLFSSGNQDISRKSRRIGKNPGGHRCGKSG